MSAIQQAARDLIGRIMQLSLHTMRSVSDPRALPLAPAGTSRDVALYQAHPDDVATRKRLVEDVLSRWVPGVVAQLVPLRTLRPAFGARERWNRALWRPLALRASVLFGNGVIFQSPWTAEPPGDSTACVSPAGALLVCAMDRIYEPAHFDRLMAGLDFRQTLPPALSTDDGRCAHILDVTSTSFVDDESHHNVKRFHLERLVPAAATLSIHAPQLTALLEKVARRAALQRLREIRHPHQEQVNRCTVLALLDRGVSTTPGFWSRPVWIDGKAMAPRHAFGMTDGKGGFLCNDVVGLVLQELTHPGPALQALERGGINLRGRFGTDRLSAMHLAHAACNVQGHRFFEDRGCLASSLDARGRMCEDVTALMFDNLSITPRHGGASLLQSIALAKKNEFEAYAQSHRARVAIEQSVDRRENVLALAC